MQGRIVLVRLQPDEKEVESLTFNHGNVFSLMNCELDDPTIDSCNHVGGEKASIVIKIERIQDIQNA